MNPLDLSASELLIWGIVLHLIGDWLLQTEWMVLNKMKRRVEGDVVVKHRARGRSITRKAGHWWDRHPSAYVHSAIHGALLSIVFGWAAVPLAFAHFIIDCRWVVEKWSKFTRQTQPSGKKAASYAGYFDMRPIQVVDVGLFVRFWTDQVFHIVCIAVAALLVT